MKSRPLKTSLIAALLAMSAAAQASHADDAEGFTTRARVLSSTPVYDTVNSPRRECWTETDGYETRSTRDSNGGAILGAIAGGLIGSTVGKGNGRVAAAAVGAATGATATAPATSRVRARSSIAPSVTIIARCSLATTCAIASRNATTAPAC